MNPLDELFRLPAVVCRVEFAALRLGLFRGRRSGDLGERGRHDRRKVGACRCFWRRRFGDFRLTQWIRIILPKMPDRPHARAECDGGQHDRQPAELVIGRAHVPTTRFVYTTIREASLNRRAKMLLSN